MALMAGITAQAQTTIERSVIGSAGFATPTLSFTVGEVITNTATAGSIVLTQGFQQPDTILSVGINTQPETTIAIQLYPNPTSGNLNLKFAHASGAYTITVRNVLGQECMALPILLAPTLTTIDVSGLSAGMYYVRIDDGQNHGNIIKFQKID